MAHLETELPLQQNILIFYFLLFFSVSLANTISAEPSPEILQLEGLHVCARWLDVPKIKFNSKHSICKLCEL